MTVLGIDTSNYTTSLSLVSEDGFVHVRRILNVKKGECGLRQSDALFLHTQNLPALFSELFESYKERFGKKADVNAVAYSAYPRDTEGSYMPCFLAGQSAAAAVSSATGVPLFKFSHQAGHIMAALKTCCGEKEIGDEFLALHLSGGTTELVRAKANDDIGLRRRFMLIVKRQDIRGVVFAAIGLVEFLALFKSHKTHAKRSRNRKRRQHPLRHFGTSGKALCRIVRSLKFNFKRCFLLCHIVLPWLASPLLDVPEPQLPPLFPPSRKLSQWHPPTDVAQHLRL